MANIYGELTRAQVENSAAPAATGTRGRLWYNNVSKQIEWENNNSKIVSAQPSLGIVSVKQQFGAVGDGITDDTTALQAAVDSLSATGGTVYFPVGTYLISSTISVPSGVSLQGAGTYGLSIILYTGSTNNFKMVSYATGAARVKVDGLQFQCNTVGLRMIQLYMGDPVYFDISNCVFGGPVHANAFTAIKLESLTTPSIPPRGYGSIRNIVMSTLEAFADSYTVGMRGIIIDGTIDPFTNVTIDGEIDLEGCEIAIQLISVSASSIYGSCQIDGSGTAAATALSLTGCQNNLFCNLKLGAVASAAFLLAQGGTYPTGFGGTETLTLGYDGVGNFTTNFNSGAQTLAQVVSQINSAAGVTMAVATAGGQLKLKGISTTDSVAQVRVVSASAPGVLTKLGLVVGTYVIPPQIKMDAASIDNCFVKPTFLQPHSFSLAAADASASSKRTTWIGTGDSSLGTVLPGPLVAQEGAGVMRTWNPVYTATGSSGVTYGNRYGSYCQVGNVIFFVLDVTMGASTFGTGQVQISLPVSGNSISSVQAQIPFTCSIINYTGGAAGDIPIALWAPGSPGLINLFTYTPATGGVATFTGAKVQATTEFIISGAYFL